MTRRKSWLYASALLATTGVGAWFIFQNAPQPEQPKTAAFAAAPPVLTAGRATGSAQGTLQPAPSVPNGPGPSALYDKFARSTTLGATYAEFAALAPGNPEAQYFQGAIVWVCKNYVGKVAESTEKNILSQGNDPNRVAALNQIKDSCKSVPAEAFTPNPLAPIRDAASRGDPKAKAMLTLIDNPRNQEEYLSAIRDAHHLANTKDPVVLDNLAGYFTNRRDGPFLWRIPGVEGTVSGYEMAIGFHLAACDYGLDCSATSHDALAACAGGGRCNQIDRPSDIQQNLLTPVAFNRAQAVRGAITLGLATGTWPDGFWSGTNESRRGK